MNTEAGKWKEVKQNLGPSSPMGELHDRDGTCVRLGIQDLRGRKLSCLAQRARSLKEDSSVIECTSGICALVDSSYITVNLIKYMVIPIEGILISWVRNKLFSLLLQMKTSLLFLLGRHVLGGLTCPMVSSSVSSPTGSCCLA